MNLRTFFLIGMIFFSGRISVQAALDPQGRPKEVTADIQKRYQTLLQVNPSWSFNGSQDYVFLTLSTQEMLWPLVQEAIQAGRKAFYALDIGAGNFSWGHSAMIELKKRVRFFPTDGFEVHVISVTGERYEGEELVQEQVGTGSFFHHRLSGFKIEALAEELKKRGFPEEHSLKNRVDLIVSRYTFIHLVDPLGTFLQAYSLLRPQGLILMQTFPVLIEGERLEPFAYSLAEPLYRLLQGSHLSFMTYQSNNVREVTEMVLQKGASLSLPLEYVGLGSLGFELAHTNNHPYASFQWIEKASQAFPKVQFGRGQEIADRIMGDLKLFDRLWELSPHWQTKGAVAWSFEVAGKPQIQIVKDPVPWVKSVRDRDLKALKELLRRGKISVNVKNRLGVPLLHQVWSPEAMEEVLRYGDLDPNIRNEENQETAVHALKDTSLLTLLWNQKQKTLDLELQDARGRTPLHLAVLHRNAAKVLWLLEHGGMNSLKDSENKLALEQSDAQKGPLAEALNLWGRLSSGENPASSEVTEGVWRYLSKNRAVDQGVISFLLRSNVDPNLQNPHNGKTLAHFAKGVVLQELVKKGFNKWNEVDSQGGSPLLQKLLNYDQSSTQNLKENSLKEIRLLIQGGAHLDLEGPMNDLLGTDRGTPLDYMKAEAALGNPDFEEWVPASSKL